MMPRPRTGYIYEEDGKVYVRKSYSDESGRREFRRRARNRTHARAILAELDREIEQRSKTTPEPTGSFQELADWYQVTYVIPPMYRDDHKVAGLRDTRTVLYRLRLLCERFGSRLLSSITYEDIRAYKLHRLNQTTQRGKSLSLSSVHRELALLRRMFQLAVRSGRLSSNPFQQGEPLIVKAFEKRRKRHLTLTEETRLLFECTDLREHLRPIVICALDTGMRAGEIFSLTWNDVNLPKRMITVPAMNTKTLTQREIPISARLAGELKRLWQARTVLGNHSVFGIQRSISKAWKTATRNANVVDVRFHDLRHTFASRLAGAGIHPFTIALLMGHSFQSINDLTMTLSYTHLTPEMIEQVLVALSGIEARRIDEVQNIAAIRSHKR